MRFVVFLGVALIGLALLIGCATAAPTPQPPTSSPPPIRVLEITPTPQPSPTAQIHTTPANPAAWAEEPCPTGTIYASPTGSDDTGDGTLERPFYSLNRATSQMSGGGTVCVRGGVYTAAKDFILVSATAEEPLRVRPYPNEEPILDGTGAEISHIESVLLILHSAHVIVEGLEVRNSSGRGISVYESEHVTVQYNRVHHVQTRAIGGGGDHITFAYNHIWEAVLENTDNAYNSRGGWAGALASYGREDGTPSTNITMRGNLIHNVWGEGIIALRTRGFVVEDNIVYDAYSVNLYISKVSDGRFERNYLYTTTSAYNRNDRTYPAHGLTLANEGASAQHPIVENLVIRNNVIVGTGAGISYWHYPYAPSFADNTYRHITITHNVIMDTHHTAVAIDTVPTLLHNAPQDVLLADNIIFAGHNGQTISLGNASAWTLSNNIWPDGLPSYGDPTGLVITPTFISALLGGPRTGFALVPDSVGHGRGLTE